MAEHTWRGAEFEIEIVQDPQIDAVRVTLDGDVLPENMVPVQPSGTTHHVRVVCPAAAAGVSD